MKKIWLWAIMVIVFGCSGPGDQSKPATISKDSGNNTFANSQTPVVQKAMPHKKKMSEPGLSAPAKFGVQSGKSFAPAPAPPVTPSTAPVKNSTAPKTKTAAKSAIAPKPQAASAPEEMAKPIAAGEKLAIGAEKKKEALEGKALAKNKPADKQDVSSKDRGVDKEMDNTASKPKKKPQPTLEEKTTTLYLSADDSNSQASPVVARSRIQQGRYVDPGLIRTYEFLNYYSFNYPPAKKNSVAIYPEMQKKGSNGEYTLQVAVRSEDRKRNYTLPLNFTFVVDISGSMAGGTIELVKSFMKKFMNIVRKGDRFSVIVCNRQARVVINNCAYAPKQKEKLQQQIIAALRPDDVTDLHRGIELAYQLAQKNYVDEFLNRVVLLSDGATNAGKLSIDAISKHSEDSERRGIYLVGVAFGDGTSDALMNAFTDAGKGAYFFITSELDIEKSLGRDFIANFDLAVKDVRLKMVMPGGWSMVKFHGEQVSTVASEVIPQHLAPNDQMIYHQVIRCDRDSASIGSQQFVFEAEFRDAVSNQEKKVVCRLSVEAMLKKSYGQIDKGNAIVAYAEMFKGIQRPLMTMRAKNLKVFTRAFAEVSAISKKLSDPELTEIGAIMGAYQEIITNGESLPRCFDKDSSAISHTLGLEESTVITAKTSGANPSLAVKTMERLGSSTQLLPRQGYKFLVMSTGPIGNHRTKGGGQISSGHYQDPIPEYMGRHRIPSRPNPRVHDLHQVTLTLKAPAYAKSFSFDFNYFSAEYPEYVKKNFNDTFYAIIEAKSTNNGARTNIAFDANSRSIEVDNNYFQNPFHPISNRGTGFDNGGSTSWLRTSWPIKGGEEFRLTFSIHDEGDGIYDSLVLLDNFQWHSHECVGNTDPLN